MEACSSKPLDQQTDHCGGVSLSGEILRIDGDHHQNMTSDVEDISGLDVDSPMLLTVGQLRTVS